VHFTIEETEDSHPIFKSKRSHKILEAISKFNNTDIDTIYYTFTNKTEDFINVDIDRLRKESLIYKHYLNHRLSNYFKEKELIVVKDFVSDLQVWLSEKKTVRALYK
jgi:hypothetical protein